MEPAHKPKNQALYRECLKNHAASLGGHALDGCGEFMVSPTSKPSDPTSLTCAACGCHRNFHRRLDRPRPESEKQANEEDEEEDRDVDNFSAPHMLMALSGAGGGISSPKRMIHRGGGEEINGSDDPLLWQKQGTPKSSNSSSRKRRFRTKFSPQQKERMHELSEVLGWRNDKRDELLVEKRCRDIGIGKGVFKVWMHNNKRNFVQSSTTTVPVTTVPVTNGNGSMIVKVNASGSD